MGNRLSKIVTRTGDAGTTDSATARASPRTAHASATAARSTNSTSTLGVLLAHELPDAVRALLGVQNDLFDLGGELCIPTMTMIGEAHIERVEDFVAQFNADLAPLKDFILPGGTPAAAQAHPGTVCRRVERRIRHLASQENVSEFARKYINRLSDLLFVLGRVLNAAAGRGDVLRVHAKTLALVAPSPTPPKLRVQ